MELALRQQLGTYARKRSGPRLTALDRSFWIALSSFWPPWKEALVVFSHRAVGNFSDPPLVLLLETQERRAPSAKQMSLGSYDALEARFEGVGPGDYVALIEPMPHLI